MFVQRYHATISELTSPAKGMLPFPLEVIPNHMGINLSSVAGMSWGRREDGQLTDLTIHFIPADAE